MSEHAGCLIIGGIVGLHPLEQLGWIPLADEWLELRRIRNEFAHDYPENPELHLARLRHAMAAGQRLMEILGAIVSRKNGGLAVEMSRGLQVSSGCLIFFPGGKV